MKYKSLILFGLFSAQLSLFGQEQLLKKFLPKEYDTSLYKITNTKIIKYYHNTVKDYEIEIAGGDSIHFTLFDNDTNSNVLKIEKFCPENLKDQWWIITYRDGTYEKGAYKRYFRDSYKKGIWKIYNSKGEIVASGRYKKFIILRRHVDIFDEDKEDNYKQGKWKYYNEVGKTYKIIKYKKGKIKKTKMLTETNGR